MGPLGLFGVGWLILAGVCLALTFARRPPRWAAVWQSKDGELWPMSRWGHAAWAVLLAVTGAVCISHDLDPAWDAVVVPGFFAAGGLVVLVCWLDRRAFLAAQRRAKSPSRP